MTVAATIGTRRLSLKGPVGTSARVAAPTLTAPAFAMFMLSDAAAALVGRRYGRIHWGGSPRTVEGSLAFLLLGLGVMALLAPFSEIVFWVGAVSVGAATLAEVPAGPFNDNLRVPMVAATVLFVLERFVLGIDVGLF